MDRKAVTSGLIKSIGYDRATQTLEIEFVNHREGPTKVYQYTPFSLERFDAFTAAESLGKYFLANIKNDATLRYKKVEEPSEEKEKAAEAPASEKA
jgi:KTSC domain-containing protein